MAPASSDDHLAHHWQCIEEYSDSGLTCLLAVSKSETVISGRLEGADATGALIEKIVYDIYGRLVTVKVDGTPLTQTDGLVTVGTYFAGSLTKNPRLFQGRDLDEESGLYYFRNRQYDPIHGRFLSRDPMAYHDSLCLYQFVNNNPINFADPSGCGGEIINNTGDPMIICSSIEKEGDNNTDLWWHTAWHADAHGIPVKLLVWEVLWPTHKSIDYTDDADVLNLEAGASYRYGMSFNGGITYVVGGCAKIPDWTWLTLKSVFIMGGDKMIDYEITRYFGILGTIEWMDYATERWWKPTEDLLKKQENWAMDVLKYGGVAAGSRVYKKLERIRISAWWMRQVGYYFP